MTWTEKNTEKNPLKRVSEKFDLLEELQRQRDDKVEEEGYTIEADLIIKAWKRFRPVNEEKGEGQPETSRRGRGLQPRTNEVLIKNIFGPIFKY